MDILESCRKHAHGFCRKFLADAEKSVVTALFKLSEQSGDDRGQRQYYEAMQQFQAKSADIKAAFVVELDEVHRQYLHPVEPAPFSPELEPLALVQRDQLEDDLLVSVVASKANARNTESLWKLNRRLAVLRGGEEVTDDDNPFGPTKLFAALSRALAIVDVERKPHLAIYKQLGKLFIVNIGKELDRLNSLLVEQGILPNLHFVIVKESGPKQLELPPQEPETATDSEKGSEIYQQHLFDAIRALQTNQAPLNKTSGGVSYGDLSAGGEAGTDSFAPVDYALALSAIQHSQDFLYSAVTDRPVDAAVVERRLIEQLLKQRREDGRHRISRNDANIVDLVGMIFRYLFDDSRLPDKVKVLLSHLHTPYLKLALIDRSFLDDHQHSARQLLNLMAELGSQWCQPGDGRFVLPKLKDTVETIVKGFIDDVSLFDELLLSLRQLKQSLVRRSEMVERRNSEAEQGLERLEAARTQADEELRRRATEHQIPEAIFNTLYQPWQEFLSFNLLRHGDQSLSWQAIIKVLDGIFRSISPASAQDGKEAFHRRQVELDKVVKEGLDTIAYDPQAAKHLLDSLQQAQDQVYHALVLGAQPVEASSPEPLPAAVKSERHQLQSVPELTNEEQVMLRRLKDCPFGTWFEFLDQGGEAPPIPLKLAWLNKVSSNCMFVDRSGVKRGSKTLRSLAQGLCAGTVRFAEKNKKSFIERALEAVLKSLKLNNAETVE